jgi:hypothetical protein
MGRRANILRTAELHVRIPEELKTRLDLYLFSPALGRIPVGAHAQFITERLKEFFTHLESIQNARR